jgi:glycosyl transferase family 87
LMLLMAPFARLGYLSALALWTALGLAIFVPVIWRYLGERRAVVAVLCSPAAVFGVISGQISFLMTALAIGAFVWLDRRPVAAGMLIGALTLKPHLGVLFPIVLALSRRWVVFAAATITALALAALSMLLFGVTPWIDYIGIGLPVQNLVLADPDGIATPFYPTLFMNLRGIGLPYTAAMAAQAALALVAATMAAWAFRNCKNEPRVLAALFFACSLSALPYMLAYDTLALCVAALALLADGTLDARGRLLARLIYWLPLLQIGLGTLYIPGPALIAPAFALCLFMRLYAAEHPHGHAVLRTT